MKFLLLLSAFLYCHFGGLMLGATQDAIPMIDFTIPEGFTVMEQAIGDLDKDQIAEKVVVFDTNCEDIEGAGTVREIHIFKKNEDRWVLWHKSKGAVLSATNGRMGMDPFESMSIERGCIVFFHFMGGASFKSNHTHRFRYQNNTWELIGVTSLYGGLCLYWETFDYNLLTGRILYKKETESCDDGTSKVENKTMVRKMKVLPKMDGFSPANNEMKFPDLDRTFYY